MFIIWGVTIHGRRLLSFRSTVNFVYIETSLEESTLKGDNVMLTISDLIAVLSLAVTCFALGFTVGHSKAKK